MRTKLNIGQRWGAIVLLASIDEGSFRELKMVKTALELLKITDKEKKEYGIVVQNKTVVWDLKNAKKEKDFTFDDALFPFMSRKLMALNEQGKLRSEMYDIAELLGVE